MGYGWNRQNGIVPEVSQCNMDALAYVFQWAFEGAEPHEPPANGPSIARTSLPPTDPARGTGGERFVARPFFVSPTSGGAATPK